MYTFFRLISLMALLWAASFSTAHADRIKDLTSMAAMRGNQLIGYGLVVGLQGTGDKKATFTSQSMKTLLNRMGLNQDNDIDKFSNAIASGSDELAVFDKSGGGVAMVSVETEDDHKGVRHAAAIGRE